MNIDYETVRKQVIELVLELAPEPPAKGVDVARANFGEDLGYHSVVLVELGFAIEERFGLDPITAEDVEDVENPDDLARFVAARLALNPAG